MGEKRKVRGEKGGKGKEWRREKRGAEVKKGNGGGAPAWGPLMVNPALLSRC